MQATPPTLLNSIFKQENLEKLYTRVDDFRKVFLNMQRFLTENYNLFGQFGKSVQKVASTLEEYLKNYISDEKNCYFMAKYVSMSFYSFGDDFSKIFSGLSADMNASLVEIQEKINGFKVNFLDVSMAALANYYSIEATYFKTLSKYKKACKDAEESLLHYEESQKEAKSIYNLSIMRRNLARVKLCVQKVSKNEHKLRDVIELLNSKRKAFSINALETVTSFKDSYKFCLVQFYELAKKNGDALSSFMSMFTHIIREKKSEFAQVKTMSCLPFPNEFGMNKRVSSATNIGGASHSSKPAIEDWPDFLKHPEEITDLNLLDYADWAQNYAEKVYEIAEHRRKILKHLRICLQEFSDLHDNFSKLLSKSLKNVYMNANWAAVGDEIFTINETLNQIIDCVLKKFGGFGNFLGLKIATLENVLLENQKNLKISYSSICKTIKDHTLLRNNLLKVQNFAFRTNKTKAISLFSPQKDAATLKEAQEKTRNSIVETAINIKTLIGEFSIEEKKKLLLFKETMDVVFSQMEFFFSEIVDMLRQKNERIFRDFDKIFHEATEQLFFRLIANESKINELFKPSFKGTIMQEKDNDVMFFLEFDRDTHPIYQRILSSQPEDTPKLEASAIRDDRKEMSSLVLNENLCRMTFGEKVENPTPLNPDGFPSGFPDEKSESNIAEKPGINIVPASLNDESLEIRKTKSQTFNFVIHRTDRNFSIDPNNLSINKEIPDFGSDSPLRKKSLDMSIGSMSAENDRVRSELNSPISIKGMKPKCLENLDKEKSKFSGRPLTFDPDQIVNQKLDRSSNFDLSSSPKKKKSTYSFFKNKFGLSKAEAIDDIFSCALMDKMLIQGKLFISNRKLCFHSYFNRYTLLGETKMIIPKHVIQRIEKRINALIFDNSIAVITNKGEIFFTSFVFRDRAYVSILKMIQPPDQRDLQQVLADLDGANKNSNEAENAGNNVKEEESTDEINENTPEKAKPTEEEIKIDEALQKKLDERATAVLTLCPKDDFYRDIRLSHTFSVKCRVDDIYRILFSSDSLTFRGKTYKGFWEFQKVFKSGDSEFSITEYDPAPPQFFTNGKGLEDLPNEAKCSERKAQMMHPMKKPIPFMPKAAFIKETHKIYWISNKEIQFLNEIRSEKVPYADSFFITTLYHVRPNEAGKIEIVTRFQITFVKKTMMQGTIERTVVQETTDGTNQVIYPAMDEFLKGVLKSKEYQAKFPQNQGEGKAVEGTQEKAEEEEEEKGEEVNEVEVLKKRVGELEGKLQGLERKMRVLVPLATGMLVLLVWLGLSRVFSWLF